ncbi:MAG: hypothetical protein CSYNP_03274 [Syntrophus sp. SKADARSKE-3]|nr:hypothetical protein [Syntrophus sp. SKADARSKE-3]
MPTTKKDSWKGGPKTVKRTSGPDGDRYPAKRPYKKISDFGEEKKEWGERKPAPRSPRSYGYEKREGADRRDAIPATRKTYAPPRPAETSHETVSSSDYSQPIPGYKLKKGLEAAKAEIAAMADQVANLLTEDYTVRDVEFSVSFNAEGKFIGFGKGGSATIKIRLAPVQ